MEHFLLPGLVVVRGDDVDVPRDLVLDGVAVSTMAQFQIGDRLCLSGIAESPAAADVGAPAAVPVLLGGAPYDLWELPLWLVGSWTVLHLVLAKVDDRPVDHGQIARQLIGTLDYEADGVAVSPHSTGTFGGDSLVQFTAEFEGHLPELRIRWLR